MGLGRSGRTALERFDELGWLGGRSENIFLVRALVFFASFCLSVFRKS